MSEQTQIDAGLLGDLRGNDHIGPGCLSWHLTFDEAMERLLAYRTLTASQAASRSEAVSRRLAKYLEESGVSAATVKAIIDGEG